MKKIFFSALAGVLCVCISCNDVSSSSANNDEEAQEQKNIAASDAVGDAFQTGDVSKIDSVVSDDFVDHSDHGDVKGKDSLKAMVNFVHTNFKDMKTEKIHQAAEGDYVYTWNRYTGTSDGSMGMPKGPYEMSVIEVGKFKDGKAVEHWAFMDMKTMMQMMPQPNMNEMNKKDTTKL